MDKIKPSIHQAKIYDAITDDKCSISINAVAGAGKTYTIVSSLELIPRNEKVIFCAFNKHIVTELEKRVPKNCEVYTLHKFGLMTIHNYLGNRIRINEEKVFWLGIKHFPKWKIEENKFSYVYRVAKLVHFMKVSLVSENEEAIFKLAQQQGIPIFSNEIEHAIELLQISNKTIHKELDFDDMVYLPASRNWKLRKFKYVFVDESQDLNIAQQEMVKKMISPLGGRVICVGDSRQSIYSFAGSDAKSFEKMSKMMSNTKELILPICYRCAKNIVLEAQQYNPDIQPAPNQIDGIVRDGIASEIYGDVFVLCRNTKPLIQMFKFLLTKGIKSKVKGKDIGENLISLINKTKQKTIKGLLKHLEVNKVKLRNKLIEKGFKKPENSDSMIDYVEKCEIIEILSDKQQSVNHLKKYIELMFVDEEVPGVTLSTVHRVKGLEKDTVYFLNPELIPSQYATTIEQREQEFNLMYVCITRAKKELIYIRNFEYGKKNPI